jgi:cytochrome c551/c552
MAAPISTASPISCGRSIHRPRLAQNASALNGAGLFQQAGCAGCRHPYPVRRLGVIT